MIIKLGKELPLEDVLYRIEYADHMEIDEMIQAIQRRYHRIFPDWEFMFITMPRENRARELELLIDTLRKQYKDV